MKPVQPHENKDHHFIRHVTEAGESRSVSASEHIFSQSRIKLLAEGALINRGVFDRLVAHKLLKPLEESILVDNVLTAIGIRNDIHSLIAQSTDLQSLGNEKTALYSIPGRLFIHPAIATKLTILKDQIPWLYSSACLAAIVALQLGARLGLDDRELDALVSAAIFRDLGELHIDPEILKQQGPLNPEQWRQIFTHPVTGYLILSAIPDYQKDTARLVLEHHERSDGSGYPAGLEAHELHVLSPAMAVIDTIASQFGPDGHCADPERIGIIFRLTTHKFDRNAIARGLEIANCLSNSRQGEKAADEQSGTFRTLLTGITHFLESWHREVRPQIEGLAGPLLNLLDRRIRVLETYLSRAGLDPANIEASQLIFAEDQALQSEAAAVLKETDWHRRGIGTELHRVFQDLRGQVGEQTYQALISWLK